MEGSAGVRRAVLKAIVPAASLLLAFVTLLLGFTGTAWAGGWLKTGDIHTSIRDVGFDAKGNAIAVGIGLDDSDQPLIQEVTRSPGGGWSAPKTIAGPITDNAGNLQLAVNSKGEAVALWSVWEDEGDGSQGDPLLRRVRGLPQEPYAPGRW